VWEQAIHLAPARTARPRPAISTRIAFLRAIKRSAGKSDYLWLPKRHHTACRRVLDGDYAASGKSMGAGLVTRFDIDD